MTPLFDPGLQPERTLLAWRRTLLAVTVAGLIGLRLLPASLGAWSLPLPLLLLVAVLILHIASERRFRRVYTALAATRTPPTAGTLALILTLLVCVCAAAGIAAVLVLAGSGLPLIGIFQEGWSS